MVDPRCNTCTSLLRWTGRRYYCAKCKTFPDGVAAAAPAVEFTPEEANAGRAMRGNTLHYCCYGMYCDAGHSSDCRFASGVSPSEGKTK